MKCIYRKSTILIFLTIFFLSLLIVFQPSSAFENAQKIDIDTFTCGEGWGSDHCKPHKMTVDLYLSRNAKNAPLIILQHGSSGVNSAVTEKVKLLTSRNYAVVINDAFTSRGISKSHFDYDATAALGGNARSMAIDSLAIIRALQNDKRVDTDKTVIIGFSQGGLVGYWLKSINFIKSTIFPLMGKYNSTKASNSNVWMFRRI